MKRIGKFVVCAAAIAVLAMSTPAQAGKSSSKGSSVYVPNTACVIAFSQVFPKVLLQVVNCADPASISITYDVDAAKLKYAAKITFCCKKDSKIDRYSCRKSRWYCVEVKCGKVESCSETRR